ncbi:RNA polymerase sigma-70 factor [Parabacteroides sp.]
MEEHDLIIGLKQGNKDIFSYLFTTYYKNLVLFAGNFLPNQEVCEDIVQSVFLKLWADRSRLDIDISLKSYLLKAIRNSCLDEIRHKNIIHQHEAYTLYNNILNDIDTDNYILYSDLNRHLQKALQEMPPVYRSVFEMNRFEGLKYKEIAIQLNVSERTVEVRMGKALELLRRYLKDFLLLAFYGYLKYH